MTGHETNGPERLSRVLPGGFVALLLALLLPGVAVAQDPAAGVGTAAAATISDTEADEMITRIEQFAADAEASLAAFRSEYLHPDVVVETVGMEPAALTAWVSEETRWVPYLGSLRGSRGVLMDRTGNSLDRALLLAELVSEAGLETRLARTRLPADVAADALTTELARPVPAPDTTALRGEDVAAAHRSDAASAADELAAMVGLQRGGDPALMDRAAEAMADHWWVQARTGDGWTDLDPLFGPSAGDRPAAVSTSDPSDPSAYPSHSVTVRLVIERSEAGGLTEEVPLEHTILAGAGSPLTSAQLSFDVWMGPDAADEITSYDEMGRYAGFWRPALRVGGDVVQGEWFTHEGTLAAPDETPLDAKLDDAGSALGALGGLADDSGAGIPATSDLSAAWLEYSVDSPGRDLLVERRQLFDLIAAERAMGTNSSIDAEDAAQRGLALMGDTSILAQSAAAHPDAIAVGYLKNMQEIRPALVAVTFLAAGREDPRIGPSMQTPELEPLDLLAMTAARSRWSPAWSSTYLARPNVWTKHALVEPVGDDIAMATAIDIAINEIDVLPGADVAPSLARLQQGVADTLVEHVVPGDEVGFNTWDRFERREVEGTAWDVWRSVADLDRADPSALPLEEVARLRSRLAAGDAVVVAMDPRVRGDEPFVDWWRVGSDGTTLGMGLRGWGSETAERGAIDPRVRQVDPRVAARHEGVQKNGTCKNFETAITVVDWMVLDDTIEMPRPDFDPPCK